MSSFDADKFFGYRCMDKLKIGPDTLRGGTNARVTPHHYAKVS
jgi:hypothetical protein